MNTQITEALARRVLEVVDAGLVCGLGVPVPGHMCVEAAVCYALGLPHSDNPPCVHPVVRSAKIELNDLLGWPSPEARARGMRRLAIAQLGTADVGDWSGFEAAAQRRHDACKAAIKPHWDAYEAAIKPHWDAYEAATKPHWDAYRAATKPHEDAYRAAIKPHEDAYRAAIKPHRDAYNAATKLHRDAYNAAILGELERYAEDLVQLLVAGGAPGAAFLYLTE